MKFTVVMSLSDASSSGPMRDTDPSGANTLKNPPNVETGTAGDGEGDVPRATRGLATSLTRGSSLVLTTLPAKTSRKRPLLSVALLALSSGPASVSDGAGIPALVARTTKLPAASVTRLPPVIVISG